MVSVTDHARIVVPPVAPHHDQLRHCPPECHRRQARARDNMFGTKRFIVSNCNTGAMANATMNASSDTTIMPRRVSSVRLSAGRRMHPASRFCLVTGRDISLLDRCALHLRSGKVGCGLLHPECLQLLADPILRLIERGTCVGRFASSFTITQALPTCTGCGVIPPTGNCETVCAS